MVRGGREKNGNACHSMSLRPGDDRSIDELSEPAGTFPFLTSVDLNDMRFMTLFMSRPVRTTSQQLYTSLVLLPISI